MAHQEKYAIIPASWELQKPLTLGALDMASSKIVARFSDGRIKKGYTWDFSPNKRIFNIAIDIDGQPTELEQLDLADLKAVYFVKTFAGNPDYAERKEFADGDSPKGPKVEVAFADGEILQGSVLRYKTRETGFFLFPVDAKSNNLAIFVVNAAVKKFRYLRPYSIKSPGMNPHESYIPAKRESVLTLSAEERKLLQLVLPRIMEAGSAREFIVENLGSAYLKIGEALLQEMDNLSDPD
jgi:hypothetical protein